MRPEDERAMAWRFGMFEVDARSGELRKAGARVALQDQPFRVLMALLQRPGEVVSRDELCRRLWSDGTFVDFEHGLNAAVRRLRVALGDGEAGRIVETVPRRGYRLVGQADPSGGPSHEAHAFPRGGPSEMGPRLRLAVLPFLSAFDRTHERFCDGLTEETTVQLACRCPRRVGIVARTTARLIGRGGASATGSADVLRVDYVLEGSVRSAGTRVRIVTELIDARAETHLWAETYERELGDALGVQADVACRIAEAVAGALSVESVGSAFRRAV